MPRRDFPPARPTRLYQSYPLEAAGGGGGSGADLSDYYTKTDVDNLFPKKAGTETISGLWTFTAKATFDQGTLSGFAPAFARNIEALYDSALASGNDLSILGMVNQTTATTGGPQGIEGYAVATHSTGTVNTMIGTVGNAEHAGAGTVSDMRGHTATVGNSSTGTTTAAKGIHIANGFKTGAGSITTLYGLFIDDQTVGDTDYSIYTKAGMVSFGDDLYLRDAVTYPTDSLLYRTSTGQVVGTGASAQGDLIYNIDGDGWTPLAIGTTGYVLTAGAAGVPEWAANVAADTALFDGQAPSYYLNRDNHTGTEPVTDIELLPEGNVIIGGASANTYRVLTGDDIDWSSAFGAAATQIYLDGATSSFRSSLGLYAGSPETSSLNYSTAYIRGHYVSTGVTGQQGNYQYVLSAGEDSRGLQIAASYAPDNDGFWIRRGSDNASSEAGAHVWQNWKQIATAGMTDDFTFGGDLYLSDATTYPTDSLLYRTSSGLVEGTGAAATGDLVYNIDGSAWASLAIGTEGQVLKSVSGIPTWSANNASDADTLDGQHGAYYLALGNATGTLAIANIQLLAESTVIIGGASANEARALTAADIAAGTFPGANYTFTTNLSVGGSLTVDNDIYLSNGSNGMIKYTGTLVEFVPTSDDTAIPGGWARGIEWNAGGASTNAAQVGVLGSGDSISYLYFSTNAASGTSDYNQTDTMRWYPNGILYMGGIQPEIRFYETDAGTNEKYWRLYAANGVFGLTSTNDSLGGTDTIFSITRTGTGQTPDYTTWYIHDWRLNSDGNDAQYFRFYSNSTTGTTNIEMRRSSDSKMKWEIEAPSSGDFYLYNWNFQASIQDTWIWGDASSGVLTFDGTRVEMATHLHASAIYDNGTIGSGATLNVDWDNGNSQRCAVSAGNITIDVDGASIQQGTSYTIQVINISTTNDRTVTWSGVDSWVGGSPTASIQQSYGTTVVQLYVAYAQAGTSYVIGSVILDNTVTPS